MTPLRILVADDEEGIRVLVLHTLTKAGHEVVSVSTGREAAKLLQSRPFDLVVTDVVMPDGDGFELIGEIKKLRPEARIVVVSGGGQYLQGTDLLKIAKGLGAHAVVMKPFSCQQLLAGIDVALNEQMAARS